MLLCFVPADEGGTQVYVVVEAVEGRCKSSGTCGCHWGMGTEDVESLSDSREDKANPGWRNMADRLGVRPVWSSCEVATGS